MLFIKTLLKNQSGATAIEYGLIASLIVIAAMAGISNLAAAQKARYEKVNTAVTDATK